MNVAAGHRSLTADCIAVGEWVLQAQLMTWLARWLVPVADILACVRLLVPNAVDRIRFD